MGWLEASTPNNSHKDIEPTIKLDDISALQEAALKFNVDFNLDGMLDSPSNIIKKCNMLISEIRSSQLADASYLSQMLEGIKSVALPFRAINPQEEHDIYFFYC